MKSPLDQGIWDVARNKENLVEKERDVGCKNVPHSLKIIVLIYACD